MFTHRVNSVPEAVSSRSPWRASQPYHVLRQCQAALTSTPTIQRRTRKDQKTLPHDPSQSNQTIFSRIPTPSTGNACPVNRQPRTAIHAPDPESHARLLTSTARKTPNRASARERTLPLPQRDRQIEGAVERRHPGTRGFPRIPGCLPGMVAVPRRRLPRMPCVTPPIGGRPQPCSSSPGAPAGSGRPGPHLHRRPARRRRP